jgi:sugar lactone lactonase YvrE
MKPTALTLALAIVTLAAPAALAQPSLYVSSTNNTIYRVDPGGSPVTPFATGPSTISGLAVGPDNNLYIAELFGNSVSRVGPGGGTPTPFATGFLSPRGLAFGTDGFLYVANGVTTPDGLYRIARVSPSGAVDVLFATDSRQPVALASRSTGGLDVLHSDGTVSAVVQGTVSAPFASGFSGFDLAAGPDSNLYSGSGNSIFRASIGGTASLFATGFSDAWGLEFGPDGLLYVANMGNGTISRIGLGGGTPTVYATGIPNPRFLAVAIPEPSSFLLCGAAAAALAGTRQALIKCRVK